MAKQDNDKSKARKAFPAKNAKPGTPPAEPPAEPMALQKELVLLRPIRRKSS